MTHRIPYPPDKGDKIRSFHLLSQLATRHDVDLLTHVDDVGDLRHVQILRDVCRSVDVYPLNGAVGWVRAGAALLSRTPLSVAYMTRPGARSRVRELLATRDYDVIVGYSSQMAAYLPDDLATPVVFDLVDVDSEKFRTYAAGKGTLRGAVDRLEAGRLRRLEQAIGVRCAAVVLTTPREARLFRERILDVPITVITNGVRLPTTVPDRSAEDAAPLLLFVGQMDYGANVEAVRIAARDVLPRVRAKIPGARFRICGRAPTAEVRELAALEGVEVTGEVPDVEPHFAEARVALLPLRVVRGIQNKVLQSLSYGLPVVASNDVKECLGDGAHEAVFAATDAADLAAHCVALLEDPIRRRRAGEVGRAYVREHHDWDRAGEAWDLLLREVIRSHREEGVPA